VTKEVKTLPLCRNCKHYDVAQASNRAGAVMRDGVAPCNWKPPELVLPLSVTKQHHFHREKVFTPSWMQPYDGADCPCFELSSKAKS
jgi:hypothetical protein